MKQLRRNIALVLTVVGSAACLIAVLLYSRRDQSMLLRLEETGCACIVPATIAIPNPLRDISPERPAEASLTMLQQVRCEAAVAAIDHHVHPSNFCAQGVSGVRPHLRNWSLRDRVEQGQLTRLTYKVQFAGQSGSFLHWFQVGRIPQRRVVLYMGNEVVFY